MSNVADLSVERAKRQPGVNGELAEASRYAEAVHFDGIPVPDMTREQLIGVIGLYEKHVQSGDTRAQHTLTWGAGSGLFLMGMAVPVALLLLL